MTTTDLRVYDSPALQPWTVDAADFPTGGTMAEIIEFCLRYAILAPSSHNSQPWWFAVDGNSVVIGLDPSRGLAVVDPDDREGTISVGAAAFILRVALSHFGFSTRQTLWPDPHDPDACVQLDVTDVGVPDKDLEPLFEGITERHTSRQRFSDSRLPDSLLEELTRDARAEGADLHLLTDYPARHEMAELVSAADREQMADKRFRRELASWLRSPYTHRHDGVRGYGVDRLGVISVAIPLVVRTFDVGGGQAARDVDLATGSPVLAVVTSPADDRTEWLRAGAALARLSLRATVANLHIGFLNQPIEVASMRAAVAAAIGTADQPQLILRMGYGDPSPAQPRRPVRDSLTRP